MNESSETAIVHWESTGTLVFEAPTALARSPETIATRAPEVVISVSDRSRKFLNVFSARRTSDSTKLLRSLLSGVWSGFESLMKEKLAPLKDLCYLGLLSCACGLGLSGGAFFTAAFLAEVFFFAAGTMDSLRSSRYLYLSEWYSRMILT